MLKLKTDIEKDKKKFEEGQAKSDKAIANLQVEWDGLKKEKEQLQAKLTQKEQQWTTEKD